MTLPRVVDDLEPVVERLVALYGAERRQQIVSVVDTAWHMLRCIADPCDRRVTTARLARVELAARLESHHIGDTAPADDAHSATVIPLPRRQPPRSPLSEGMWAVEPVVP